MGNAFDSIDDSVLKQLDSKAAVKLLHKLIYSEAKRLSIPVDLISVPFEVDTPDGGIDAVLKTDAPISDSELIFQGKTYYQVKSGDNVQFSEAGLKNILCEDRIKKGATEKDLKPKIRSVAEENGTLVLFFTGRSAPNVEDALKNARKVIEHYLPDTKLTIRIVQADNIIAMLDNFLALRHDLLHIQGFPGLLFHEWEIRPIMDNHFEQDDRREEKIKNLRTLLRSTSQDDRTVRVTGYPGIGKTRSVLEALRQDDLTPLVLYFDKPSRLIDTNLLVEMGTRRQNDAIVVVDECDHHSHIQLVSALAGASSNIKLVTIYNEPSGTVKSVKNFDLNEDEQLSTDAIIAIIESYKLPKDVAQRWEPFCDGSPRVAHMIAENLSRNTGDLLSNPSYDLAMERILANTEQLESETYKTRKNIISWLALFQKFGWGRDFSDERQFIVNKIREKTQYSEDDIETVIQELKDRKVLQGDKTLYTSPRLLHIRAWVWWWEKYADNFDLANMRKSIFNGTELEMTDELYGWFTNMFEYAREVKGASEVVEKLLAIDGPLGNEPELMEALSGNFFYSLTKADPENALLILEKWFEGKTDVELREYRDIRMTLVRTLETIAIWGPLFVRAAQLMLRLASTEEDHTYSNNSEGTFASLFSNGWGKVAPTEAPPAERLPILRRALASDNTHEQMMGLKGINAALETDHFMRISGAEVQGLRAEPKLWVPETYKELYDAFRSAWLLLLEVLPDLEGEPRNEALRVIDTQIRGLVAVKEDALKYLEEYADLVKNDVISKNDAINSLNTLRRYDKEKFSADVIDAIQELSDYLEGSDFTSRLKRFIAYDSVEDWWGDDEDVKVSEAKVAGLVREIISDPELLNANKWLFTNEAKNGHRLGQGIAKVDQENLLLDRILDLQKESDEDSGENKSLVFTSGYLWVLAKSNNTRWQSALNRIKKDDTMVRWYAEACWRSQLNDHNAVTILELIKKSKLSVLDLSMFRFGGMVKSLSAEVFHQWIEYLLDQNAIQTTGIAIDLFAAYYVFQEDGPVPKELTDKILTSAPLAEQKDREIARAIDYDWSTIAKKYVKQYPKDALSLADVILDNFGEDDTIYGSYNNYVKEILNELIKLDPARMWTKVAARLDGGIKEFKLQLSWLGDNVGFGSKPIGAIVLFPKKIIIDWIDEDPKNRARKIAAVIPHDFDDESSEDTWYATILDKYGDDKGIQNALYANLGTEGWSGPESLHYAGKLERLKRFAELNKKSKNIQSWTRVAIDDLNKRVRQARLNEERRDY